MIQYPIAKTAKDLLVQTRQLLTDPAHWCQHNYAQDIEGNDVGLNDPRAVSFCLIGAMSIIEEGYHHPLFCQAKRILDPLLPNSTGGLSRFNDDSSHSEVIALLDTAIASLP